MNEMIVRAALVLAAAWGCAACSGVASSGDRPRRIDDVTSSFDTDGNGARRVISQPDGTVLVFKLAGNPSGGAGWIWMGSAGDTAWAGLPSDHTWYPPAAGRNADGRIELFAVDPTTGAAFHNWQSGVDSRFDGWAGWLPLGSPIPIYNHAFSVGQNGDGRLEVFALSGQGVAAGHLQMFHIWQLWASGPWSDWTPMGGDWLANPGAVARNQDGRLEMFMAGIDGVAYHSWQVEPNGGWTDWVPLPGEQGPFGALAFLRPWGVIDLLSFGLKDGSSNSADGAVWRQWQTSPGGAWSGWSQLDDNASYVSADGALDGQGRLFAITSRYASGGDIGFYVDHEQWPAGPWTGFQPLPFRDGNAIDGWIYGACRRLDNGHVVIVGQGKDQSLASIEEDDDGSFSPQNWVSLNNP